jgi:hypothetical protein
MDEKDPADAELLKIYLQPAVVASVERDEQFLFDIYPRIAFSAVPEKADRDILSPNPKS